MSKGRWISEELTDNDLHSACLSYRHDYGLMSESEQAKLRLDCRMWHEAIYKNSPIAGGVDLSRVHDEIDFMKLPGVITAYYPFDAICRANGIHSNDEKTAIAQMTVHAISKHLATLQPKPVEVGEWNELSKEEMWDEIQAIRKLTDNDGTMSPRHSVANLVEELEALRPQSHAPVEQASEPWQLLAEIQIVAALNDGSLPGEQMRKLKAALEAYPNYKEPVVEVLSVEDIANKLFLEFDEIPQWTRRRISESIHALLQSKGRYND